MGPRAGLDGCEKSRPYRDCFLFSVLHLYYFFALIVLALSFVLTVQHKHKCPRRDSNPAIPASHWQQTLALDRSATGIGKFDPRTVQL